MTDAADPSIIINDAFELQRQVAGRVYDPPNPAAPDDAWVVANSPVRVDLPQASITLYAGVRVVAGSHLIDGVDLFELFEKRVE